MVYLVKIKEKNKPQNVKGPQKTECIKVRNRNKSFQFLHDRQASKYSQHLFIII